MVPCFRFGSYFMGDVGGKAIMDPTANLAEIRQLVAKGLKSSFKPPLSVEDQYRLLELIEALDWWLMRGGFLPQSWAIKVAERLKETLTKAAR
jgi:hypothetical protein